MFAATNSFSLTCTMQARHNFNQCNWRPVDWLISINSNTPAGRNHLKSHFLRSQCHYRRTLNHCSMNGKTFGIQCIPQKILFFHILDSVSHAYTLLCDCRGGSKNEKCPVAIEDLVPLYNAAQEGLNFLLKMIGVHLTCLLYVRAQKMVLSNFVKLTSNAFALTCMIIAWFELMLSRVILTLMLADTLQNGLQEKRFAGNETVYAVSRSPPPLSRLFYGAA